MTTVTVSKKFQIVIPKKSRDFLNLRPGQELVVLEKPDSIVLVKVGPIKEAKAMFHGVMEGANWKDIRDHSERFD